MNQPLILSRDRWITDHLTSVEGMVVFSLVDFLAIDLSRFLFFLTDQSRIFLHIPQYKFLPEKYWSELSDKIHVDRSLAVEARIVSPDKILVFLSDSLFSGNSCLILFSEPSCLILFFWSFLPESVFLTILAWFWWCRCGYRTPQKDSFLSFLFYVHQILHTS